MADKSELYYGMGGRLKKSPSKNLINSAYAHDCEDAPYLIEGLHQANMAYAIALGEAGVIPKDTIENILEGLLKLSKKTIQEIKIDPALGDVYNSYDDELRSIIGDDSGWLHAGRPRREAVNIAFLIETRKQFLTLIGRILDLIEKVIEKAKSEASTIMPDFTYMHHAQPTVLGHYLLTFVSASLRDLNRIREVYERLNESPGGSGSVNGTRLPVDRSRIMELLGFSSLTLHTRDAMWKPDLPLEIMYILNSFMLNWSRLAEEFIVWNTAEFSLISLPDELCRASVIMPQKKNPYILTYFRGLTGSLTGKLSSYAVFGKTASGFPDSRIFVYGDLPYSIKKCSDAVSAFGEVIEKSTFNKARMKELVSNGFSMVTDIADELILRERIDYKSAHKIIGRVVSNLLNQNLKGKDMTLEHLQNAYKERTGVSLKWEKDFFENLILPENIVASRRTIGGAAQNELYSLIDKYDGVLAENKQWFVETNESIEQAKSRLFQILK